MNTFLKFIVGRVRSFKYAFRGMFMLIGSEHSIITQILIFLIVIALGVYLDITRFEWIIQIILFGFIFAIEGLNTAVEKLSDFVHPDYHKKIKDIKDVAAGSVNFAAITTFVVLCIIYYPYFLEMIE